MWLTKRRSYHQIQTGKYIEIYCPTNGRKTEVESEKKRIIWFFEEKHGIAETLTFSPWNCSDIAYLSYYFVLSLMQIESRYVSVHVVPRLISCSSRISFNRWNKVFHALEQSVSSNETKCFKRWNKVFQAFETIWNTCWSSLEHLSTWLTWP